MILRPLVLFSLSCLTLPVFAQMDDSQLSVWVNEAIVSTYTYNYQDFLTRQKAIAKYFTADGWIAYSKALNDSKLPDAVQSNSYYVSAVATLPPTIKSRAENKWEATMPLLVVYSNPQYQQKQTLLVSLTFVAAPSGQGVRDLAISSLQSKVVTPSCKCPIDDKEDTPEAEPATTPPAK